LQESQAAILGYICSNSFDSTGIHIATTLYDGAVYDDFKANLKSLKTEMLVDFADKHNIRSFDERKYSYLYTMKNYLDNDTNIINLLAQNGLKNKSPSQKVCSCAYFQFI
jgi:hypothetical protein